MRTFIYLVKNGDSVSTIAAKFGKDFRELVRINRHLPTKVIWYGGKPYTVFADLRVNQQLIIPENWVPTRQLGISGIGVGAGYGESCDYTTWCDDPYVCVNGYCAKNADQLEQEACVAQGGTWGVNSCVYPPPPQPQDQPPPVVTPTCYADVTGCNTSSECCSGYCNTNIKNIPGAAGQCQQKGVKPPAIGTCHFEGDTCGKDFDCCSSNCQNGICGQQIPGHIASGDYPCDDYDIIIAVQEYLTDRYPPLANVGEWGVWGPADTWALNDLGISFSDAYDAYVKEKGGDLKCTGGGPADVYCPGTQEFDPDTALCVDVTTKKPPKVSCGKGYKINSQGTACVPVGGNGEIIPIKEDVPPDQKKEDGFPWGWVLLGVAVVGGGGAIAYYATKDKSKKTATSSEPVKSLETTSAMAAESRRFVRSRRY